MISEYYRPKTLAEAMGLLARTQPLTLPLGGGTVLSRPVRESFAVVDLQDLGLDKIQMQGNQAWIGATAKLQTLVETDTLNAELRRAVHAETSLNLRNSATVAGSLASADGRSPLALVFLALDAHLTWLPAEKDMPIGDWLPLRQGSQKNGLISLFKLPAQVRIAWQAVARSPQDLALVSVAVVRWPSGRVRITAGGFGAAPKLAFDGHGSDGVQAALANVLSQADDPWATAEYRLAAGSVLLKRCMEAVEQP
jgi:CO/xanthine dehydrogenase FAD-binding subunit